MPERDVRADVHVGQHGWLFLVGGSNAVIDQYKLRKWPSRHYWRWRRLIERRFFKSRKLGIGFRQIVVPEKLSVYDHKLDGLRIDIATAPIEQLASRMRRSSAAEAWVDVLEELRARRDDADLYLRTDSHWNHQGSFLAYEVLCRQLGAIPKNSLEQSRLLGEIDTQGDLGGKLMPARRETVPVHALQRDARRVYASRIVQDYEAQGRIDDLHMGTHVVFENTSAQAQPGKIILFGDSYANFLWNTPNGSLTGLLAETFREVHFVWSPTIDWDYVETVRPDFVISEIAERFLARVPLFDYKIAALEQRVRALKP